MEPSNFFFKFFSNLAPGTLTIQNVSARRLEVREILHPILISQEEDDPNTVNYTHIDLNGRETNGQLSFWVREESSGELTLIENRAAGPFKQNLLVGPNNNSLFRLELQDGNVVIVGTVDICIDPDCDLQA